jgi:ribosomal protein S16
MIAEAERRDDADFIEEVGFFERLKMTTRFIWWACSFIRRETKSAI